MAKKRKSPMDCALKFLAYRMRSESEMIRHLEKKNFSSQEIEQTISKLKQYGYINDENFASEYIRSKSGSVGKRYIQNAMYKFGIDQQTAQNKIKDEYPNHMEQAACDKLFSKLAQKHGTDRKGLAKIQRSLLGKGFSYDAINTSFERYRMDSETYER